MVSLAARQSLLAHIEGERQRDLDALMAPLAPTPRYVIPDLVLVGRIAVRAFYERMLPRLCDASSDEYLRALDDPDVARWGQHHCILEYSDRYPIHRFMVVVIHFEGVHVLGENTYYTSRHHLPAELDKEFLQVPGVMPNIGR